MSARINIAIDGYSSCGKSTITTSLAHKLSYTHLDTGAMYRAVTYYFIDNDILFDSPSAVEEALSKINLELRNNDGHTMVILNDIDITEIIRSMMVSSLVSEVAAISAVRRFLVEKQRVLAQDKGFVVDGRDIGTVVLPEAELKIFMMADKEVRIDRRYKELLAKNQEITRSSVKANIEKRDLIDTSRADSPLTKATDAIVLDNTHMGIDEQLEFVLQLVQKKLAQST